ncbi:MAG: hypothetical protein HRU09_20300 [Oligoflexales bacterium]|nr:hypothetical protein [Oligoflexales bacterium]
MNPIKAFVIVLLCLILADRALGENIFLARDLARKSRIATQSSGGKNGVKKNGVSKPGAKEDEKEKTFGWGVSGYLGSSSFSGETSLISLNYVAMMLSTGIYGHNFHAYFQGTAQSFNSGISDHASRQSTIIYSKNLFKLIAISGGLSYIESNSRVNPKTAALYTGIELFQENNWGVGSKFYYGNYLVSVADNILTNQISPYVYKQINVKKIGVDLNLVLSANSTVVNTTYNNEVLFANEDLEYNSYQFDLAMIYKRFHLAWFYWSGVEYGVVRDRGILIRSLDNYFTKGMSIALKYARKSGSFFSIRVIQEKFYEQKNLDPASERKVRLGVGINF